MTRLSSIHRFAIAALLFLASPAKSRAEDWPEIIKSLKEAMWREPARENLKEQLALAYNNYAVEFSNQGKWDEAVAQMKEALKLEPERREFKRNLASIYVQQAADMRQPSRTRSGRTQDSTVRALLNEAINLDPQIAEAYLILGHLEYDGQRLKEAKRAWEKAKKINPNLPGLAEALGRIKDELPVEGDFDRVSHSYFDVRYENQLQSNVGADIQEMLLEARRNVGADFRYWPNYKLVALVYDGRTFRRMRQETPEWVGGQFDGKIRLPLPDGEFDQKQVKQIVFHEYTHALIYDLAKNRCPIWLNEGMAEYQGSRAGKRHSELLAQALQQDILIPWESLNSQFSTSLSPTQVGLAYQQSESIVEYLVQRYGFWRLRKILTAVSESQAVEEAITEEFHVSQARLQKDWRAWLSDFVR